MKLFKKTPSVIRSDEYLFWTLLGFSIVMKLFFVTFFSNLNFVDDAYITARYGLNLTTHGQFVYNLNEYVFGVTTPLYALIIAFAHLLFGSNWDVFILILNIFLWSISALMLFRLLRLQNVSNFANYLISIIFLLYPSFVDNQYLGMESSLFIFLMLLAASSIQTVRVYRASIALGLIFITRPEGLVFAPALIAMYYIKNGRSGLIRLFCNSKVWLLVLMPIFIWCFFSYYYYGSFIPQSMVSKSAWNSEHYKSLIDASYIINMIPRLTFFPFIDEMPSVLRISIPFFILLTIIFSILMNVRFGTWFSKGFLFFYLIYIAFYFLGRGATEASWYSIPSSVALLISLFPAFERLNFTRRKNFFILFLISSCFILSSYISIERAKLLNYYFNFYGESANELNDFIKEEDPGREIKILVGEIGVYGYLSKHYIIDVGALVSPYILELKNKKLSLIGIIQETNADYFVVSQSAIEKNFYPSVGDFASSIDEINWFKANCELILSSGSKLTYKVNR